MGSEMCIRDRNALNIELNLDEKDPSAIDTEPEQGDEPPERKNKDLER